MSGRKLDASYAAFQVQIGSHEHAKKAALRKTVTAEFLGELGLASLVGKVVKDPYREILEHFEFVGGQIRRQAFVDLVSAFEFDLFQRIGVAASKVRHTLNAHYEADSPFFSCRGDLARTTADFSNLGGYRRLLAGTATSDPRRELWDVIRHRDFLAHGERWERLANPPTVDTAYRIMSAEIDRVSPRR